MKENHLIRIKCLLKELRIVLMKQIRDRKRKNLIARTTQFFKSKANLKNSQIVAKSQKPASLMAWAAITEKEKYLLVFVPQGIEINKEVYKT